MLGLSPLATTPLSTLYVTGQLYTQSLTGSGTPSGLVVRASAHLVTAGATPTGSQVHDVQILRGGSTTPAGVVLRDSVRDLLAALSPSVGCVHEIRRAVTGSAANMGVTWRNTGRSVDAGVDTSVVLLNQAQILVEPLVPVTADLTKWTCIAMESDTVLLEGYLASVFHCIVDADQGSDGELVQLVSIFTSADVGAAGTLVKEIPWWVGGTVTSGAALGYLAQARRDGVLTPAPVLNIDRLYRVDEAVLPVTSSTTHLTPKVINAGVGSGGALPGGAAMGETPVSSIVLVPGGVRGILTKLLDRAIDSPTVESAGSVSTMTLFWCFTSGDIASTHTTTLRLILGRLMNADLASTGSVVRQTGPSRGGTVESVSSVSRHTGYGVTGTVPSATSVGRDVAHLLLADLGSSTALTRWMTRSLEGALTPLGAWDRLRFANVWAWANVTPTGAVGVVGLYARALGGGVLPATTLHEVTARALLATGLISGVAARRYWGYRSLVGTLPSMTTKQRVVGHGMFATLGGSSLRQRETQARRGAVITPATIFIARANLMRGGALPGAGVVQRAMTRALFGTIALPGDLARLSSRGTVSGVLPSVGFLGRATQHLGGGVLAPVGQAQKWTQRVLTGTMPVAGMVPRLTQKGFSGTVPVLGLQVHETYQTLRAGIWLSGTAQLSTWVVVSGVLPTNGVLVRLTEALRTAAMTPVGVWARQLTLHRARIQTITSTGVLVHEALFLRDLAGYLVPFGEADRVWTNTMAPRVVPAQRIVRPALYKRRVAPVLVPRDATVGSEIRCATPPVERRLVQVGVEVDPDILLTVGE